MVDLSEDSEASIELPADLSLSSNQLSVERVIAKVFTRYHCDVIISDRLRSLFTSKLWRMGKSIQGLGGTGRANKISKWKDTSWTVELQDTEIVKHAGRNRSILIQSDKKKCIKLKSDLEESQKKLKDVTNQLNLLEKSTAKLSSALKNMEQPSSSQSRKRKLWSQCSSQYQRKRRRQMAKDVKVALSFLKNENFQCTQVEQENNDTGEILSVSSNGQTTIQKEKSQPLDLIEKTLYIKERYNLSNVAYHELAMVNGELPRSCALTRTAKKIDTQSIIRPTPGKVNGIQQSLTERLRKRIQYLVKNSTSFATTQRIIKVKITGDGTCISHSMHAVLIAFTIITAEANPNSPGGNHTIALFNCGEDYSDLAEGLGDICDELKHLKVITVDGVEYTVEFFFGADWKFLALCCGIEAANAKYSCTNALQKTAMIHKRDGLLRKKRPALEQLKKFSVSQCCLKEEELTDLVVLGSLCFLVFQLIM